MKTRILLIDDDHGPMDYFVDALRHRGFEVEHIDTVDSFFKRLEVAPIPPDFDFVVVDMMMPHGKRLTREETDGGLTSGLKMAHAIRQKYPLLREDVFPAGVAHAKAVREKFPSVPIVAFSNYNDPEIIAQLPEGVKTKAKFETSPFEFADFIKALIPTSP
ncbi:MAG TPA: response regulator [Verrucomicrobiae bacterium]|jgi:CheY-like chemotaxis protein